MSADVQSPRGEIDVVAPEDVTTRANGAGARQEGESRRLRTVFGACLVGTSLEWYDYFVYSSAAALVFDKVFFPTFDPVAGTLLSLATFAAGFAVRPLGGIVFGHFGDTIGRKRTLTISLVLVGGATFLIGLVPSYGSIGVAAPLLLVLLRMIQGFGVGGEWGGAVLMSIEHGPQDKRGFFATSPQIGVPVGNLLSAGVLAAMTALLDDAQFQAWGWRVPFLLSAVLLVVGFAVRMALDESPMFRAVDEGEAVPRRPLLEVLKTYPRSLLLAIGSRLGVDVAYYTFAVFLLVYGNKDLGIDKSVLLDGVLVGSGLQLVLIPYFGALSDRVGRRPVYALGAVAAGIWVFAFFALLQTKSTVLVLVAAAGGFACHAVMFGVQSSFIAELFGTQVRYSGASLGFQLESIFGGGLAPIIAVAIYSAADSTLPVSLYVVAALVVTIVSVAFAKETATRPLLGAREQGDPAVARPRERLKTAVTEARQW